MDLYRVGSTHSASVFSSMRWEPRLPSCLTHGVTVTRGSEMGSEQVCVCVCTHLSLCASVSVYVCKHACVCECMHVCKYKCVHVCM